MRAVRVLLTVPLALVLPLAGCGGDSDEASDTTTTAVEATTTAPTTTEAPTTTAAPVTTAAGPQRPTTSLVATAAEWTEACKVGDKLIDQSWQLGEGTLSDKSQVAISMLSMINVLPPGAADAEKTEILALINAYLGGGDTAPFKANFYPNAESLLNKVAAGCGLGSATSLPLPPDSLTEIYDFLYPAG